MRGMTRRPGAAQVASGPSGRKLIRTGFALAAAAALLSAAFVVSGGFDHGATAATQPADASADTTGGYTGMVEALTAGKDVEVTTRLDQCTTSDGQPGPDVVGGLHIAAYQIPQHKFVAFSDTHQTLDPRNASVTEFIRYQVLPDGAITLATTTLSATGQVISTVTLNCHIGRGAYFHWSG